MPRDQVSFDALKGFVGQELGASPWRRVSQHDIDRFSEVTGDDQFIHVDPQRAAVETPFGGTVSHGFLTLSLLSAMGADILPRLEGRRMGINYGFDRVRFVAPVKAGARVRGRFVLLEAGYRTDRTVLTRYAVTVEIEGEEKPALAAEWLTLAILG
jgi:acyl dehydratase